MVGRDSSEPGSEPPSGIEPRLSKNPHRPGLFLARIDPNREVFDADLAFTINVGLRWGLDLFHELTLIIHLEETDHPLDGPMPMLGKDQGHPRNLSVNTSLEWGV